MKHFFDSRCKDAVRQIMGHEEGASTITALIVLGVAAVLLSSLLWRQQFQVRQIENARDRAQAQWLERGVVDFARLVLREDLRASNVDHLGESWALPLADSRVADFLKNAEIPDTIAQVNLQGQLIDAQSRLNLTNIWDANRQTINRNWVEAYARLLERLSLDRNLANLTAQAALQNGVLINSLESLRSLSFYTPAMIERLRPYVIVLPKATPINLNTASAEVLAAVFSGIGAAQAERWVLERGQRPPKNIAEAKTLWDQLGLGSQISFDGGLADTKSDYWLARSEITMERGIFVNTALIWRSATPVAGMGGNLTKVIWNTPEKWLPQ
jgi:general secretion pathway protein K